MSERCFATTLTVFAVALYLVISFLVNTVFAMENGAQDLTEPIDLPVISFSATVGVGVVNNIGCDSTLIIETEPE